VICAAYDTSTGYIFTRDINTDTHHPDIIDKETQEIRPEDGEVYTKMEDLADELPESAPRYILLSYPLTMVSGP
jgi:hypothetical protein